MIEKLYEIHIGYVIAIGIIISATLFSFLLRYADEGNFVLVLLLGISIGIVAILITKVIAYQRYYKQFKDM
ncbi:putative membrane protein [Methanohalophilus levihalophilus]|uniref:hypothetical protein n=1 Tax=Methanohalophilus levihalophilus TaxID=1431282 RepID=UPI001AE744E2|nr:hypothetical protein [Methanohalophilus levihalophilus]MBP2029854.1 putative membrane protein [Methanohalophilus levihalophilus]